MFLNKIIYCLKETKVEKNIFEKFQLKKKQFKNRCIFIIKFKYKLHLVLKHQQTLINEVDSNS